MINGSTNEQIIEKENWEGKKKGEGCWVWINDSKNGGWGIKR